MTSITGFWRFCVLMGVVLLFPGCSGKPAPASGPITPLPTIDLARFHPAVRKQVEEAQRKARANSSDAGIVSELGYLLHVTEMYHQAEACYQRAHDLEPDRFDWPYLAGVVQRTQGDHREAISSFEAALRLRADFYPAKLAMAEAQMEAGNVAESERQLAALVAKRPDEPRALFGLGRAKLARSDWSGAAQSLGSACELAPSYGEAHYALGTAYARLGRKEDAAREFKLGQSKGTVPPIVDEVLLRVQDNKNNGTDFRRRAYAAFNAGDFDRSEDLYLQALKIDPHDVAAHLGLMGVYGKGNRYLLVKREYDVVRKIDPKAAQLDSLFAQIMYEAKRFDLALPAYRRALAINPNEGGLYNDVGAIMEYQHKPDEAMRNYKKSVELLPGNRAALSNYGRMLVNRGRFEEGMSYHMKSLDPVDQRTPQFYLITGMAYEMWGKKAKAMEYAEKSRSSAMQYGQQPIFDAAERFMKKLNPNWSPAKAEDSRTFDFSSANAPPSEPPSAGPGNFSVPTGR